ncbi:MAG: hypothetical protein JKY95_18260 [Planctomycetaceae bacterium]|nr:hypothetical protein [Planctomycetaceae bacterium]
MIDSLFYLLLFIPINSQGDNMPPLTAEDFLKTASHASVWQVTVLGGEEQSELKYEISDANVIKGLVQLVDTNNDLKASESKINPNHSVRVDLVLGEVGDSIIKFEIDQDNLFVNWRNQRYQLKLNNAELFERLTNRSLSFSNDATPDRRRMPQPAGALKRRVIPNRNLQRRALPARNQPDLPSKPVAQAQRRVQKTKP